MASRYSDVKPFATKSARPNTRTSFASRAFEPTPLRYHARRMAGVCPRMSMAWRMIGPRTRRRTPNQMINRPRPSHQWKATATATQPTTPLSRDDTIPAHVTGASPGK